MLIMSTSMHIQGLLGGPRRSNFSEYAGGAQVDTWISYQMAQAIGGSILFIAIILMVYIFIQLTFFAPRGVQEYPIAEEEENAEPTPKLLKTGFLDCDYNCFDSFRLYNSSVRHSKTLTTRFTAI